MKGIKFSIEDAEISIFKDLAVQPVDSLVLAISVAKFLCNKGSFIIFSIQSICILIVFSYPITPPSQKHIIKMLMLQAWYNISYIAIYAIAMCYDQQAVLLAYMAYMCMLPDSVIV